MASFPSRPLNAAKWPWPVVLCAVLLPALGGSLSAWAQPPPRVVESEAPVDSVLGALRASDYERAIEWGERRRSLLEVDPRTRPLEMATTLTYLGLAYRNLDQLDRAEELARRVLRLMIEGFGAESPNAATALNNLAGVLKERGDGLGAEAAYQSSLALRRQLLADDDPALAASWNNLGTLLLVQGDAAGAREYLERAVTSVEQARGPDHSNTIQARRNLALAFKHLGLFDAAKAELDRAESALQASSSANAPQRADLKVQRAELWAARGQYDLAESTLREAIDLRREALGEPQIELVHARNLLARWTMLGGRLDEAEGVLEGGVENALQLVGPAHALTVESWITRAELALLRRQPRKAIANLEEATRAHALARRRSASGLRRATVQLEDPAPRLAAARLAAAQPVRAWEGLESSRARLLVELLDATHTRRVRPELVARESALRRRLSEQRSRVEALRGAGSAAELRSQETELARLESQWASLQDERNVGDAAVAELAKPGELLAATASRLEADQALIGWLDVDAPGGAMAHQIWVLRSNGELRWAPQTDPIDGEAFARGVRAATSSAFAIPGAEDMELQQKDLYRARIQPVESALHGVRRLMVVPSGPMHAVPVDALIDAAGESLLDRFVIEVLPSAVGRPRAKAVRREGAQRVLALGDPPFGERLPALPASREEAEQVRALFPQGELIVGKDASESTLRELAGSSRLAQFDVLHLATHAFSDGQRPERSHLVLAGGASQLPVARLAESGFLDDGRVTVGEILDEWQLDAELVTLSACSTAEGRRAGGEGVLGFAHAFFHAGARHLLMSGWEVDDEATARLMAEFYGRLRGAEPEPVAEALRNAKLTLREYTDARGQKPYAHPAYWAAFQLWSAP